MQRQRSLFTFRLLFNFIIFSDSRVSPPGEGPVATFLSRGQDGAVILLPAMRSFAFPAVCGASNCDALATRHHAVHVLDIVIRLVFGFLECAATLVVTRLIFMFQVTLRDI
jgi:hypothetical protein